MRKIFYIILFFLAFGGIITSQYLYDKEKSKRKYVEPIVLRPEIVKAVDFGLHNAASDLAWLQAIQYFGGGESRSNQKLSDYLNLSANLDPKFSYPYAFGALILPSIGYTDEGIELAKRGVEEKVPDWRIPYYLATTYHINKDDQKNAAFYFDVAANTTGAPDGIKRVAANYGSRSDRRTKTKEIWIGIYESSKDEVVKERAKNYIIHFEILDLFDEAAKRYKDFYKKNPENINDFVTGRILRVIPEDPFGFQYEIDEEGNVKVK